MKRLWNLLGRNRGLFLFTLAVDIGFCGVCVVVSLVSGDLVDTVAAGAARSGGVILLFLILSLFRILLSLASFRLKESLRIRQKQYMRGRAFDAFSRESGKGREEIASFVSYLNNDIPALAEQYFIGQIDILECVFLILFSAVSLFVTHWALALIILTISVLIVYIPETMRSRGGQAREACSREMARYNTLLGSFLGGLGILKTYRYRERACRLLDGADEAVVKSEFGRLKWQVSIRRVTTSLQVLKSVLILSVGVALIYFGRIETGGLIAVIQLADLIGSPIEVLAYLQHSRNEVLPLVERFEGLADAAGRPEAPEDAGETEAAPLSVCHVSCRADGLQILEDVSAVFEPGKKYMISGPSGSGKSTLLRLMAGVGDLPWEGEILLGERGIRSLGGAAYYRRVCPVFQEPYMFFATLEENIKLGREIPESLYRDVISRLNLEYLLERYRGQEMSPERIELLSGGERQRIALARAMVGRPEIYLLDEVTSALDQENARRIEAELLRERAAVIHVCHKPNPELLSGYDGHYIMEGGRLSPVSE